MCFNVFLMHENDKYCMQYDSIILWATADQLK